VSLNVHFSSGEASLRGSFAETRTFILAVGGRRPERGRPESSSADAGVLRQPISSDSKGWLPNSPASWCKFVVRKEWDGALPFERQGAGSGLCYAGDRTRSWFLTCHDRRAVV